MALDPKTAVLEALRQREHGYFSADLMEYLETTKQLSDAKTKAAILDLLGEMKIEFSPEQKLRLLEPAKKRKLQTTV